MGRRTPSNRPTLARVAERAGVSVSTASLAFSGSGPITPETRDKVFAAATDLGYTGPNPLGRQLRRGRSGIIGVVIGDHPRRAFRDPVAVQVLDGLVDALGTEKLGVLLIPGVDGGEDAVDPLIETAAMDVAVLVWGVLTKDPTLAALQRRDVPVVVGEGRAVEGAPLVALEDRAGAAEAVRHLVELGHTRIAEISLPFGRGERSGPVDADRIGRADRTPTVHRMAGIRDVVEPVITWETPASLVEHGRDAATEILGTWVPASERPTAIVAHSDLLAAGAVIAARELGLRIPEDVSVAGFDGLDLPWLSPDVLTSVHQPLREKGTRLGQAAIGLLAGEEPTSVSLPVGLVPGTTTGPAPVG
ncbi:MULTISPECIES: LacI family DNA-binding transcriptional regulator [unclassified Isoptericola]|uniref:LacI family DNA-binding transcriptional regulator n=1 Tax=unclassified Isoptericola TaxID=2623355 RepID=UPI0027141EC3|nr:MULTISPECIES: LacI family DNA-binding transcriptional regulator [unclassified Isoptericola]MDO8143211.1 LacI family DNA-binding transcriptional regulator [Isoptericola sp. 178]MDO8147072.1 LacI family DNA-binding transcriptional regulator [Isoptericola sp. b515]MDO8150613.1 LacI family DNA-binding transcriptional regulator [Isoptericola sp. b408]